MSDRTSDEIVVLADVSLSMDEIDGGSREGKTRLDLLKQALTDLPSNIRILAFSGHAREAGAISELRTDSGGTNLAAGIAKAATYKPIRTVIISDGEPDSEEKALREVESITGSVDVMYCGDPKNDRAKKFLASLARECLGGFYETGDKVDISKQLPAVLKGLLGK